MSGLKGGSWKLAVMEMGQAGQRLRCLSPRAELSQRGAPGGQSGRTKRDSPEDIRMHLFYQAVALSGVSHNQLPFYPLKGQKWLTHAHAAGEGVTAF